MKIDKNQAKDLFVLLFLAIAGFSVYKFVVVQKEKIELLSSLNRAKEEVAALEIVRQNLMVSLDKERALQQKTAAQNSQLKLTIRAGRERMGELFKDIHQAEKELEDVSAKFSLLKEENKALSAEKDRITQENIELKGRLSSVKELKKAIRELRHQIHKVGGEIRDKAEEQRLLEGNRGFIIKDGKVTTSSKVRIEVTPAEAPKQ